MRGIIFDLESQAKQWDAANNGRNFSGSPTKYRWSRRPLVATTTLTKAEYAADQGIPATIAVDDEGNTEDNPAYTALDSSYTVRKYALMVGSDLDTIDIDGNVTPHPDVETIEDEAFYVSSGE